MQKGVKAASWRYEWFEKWFLDYMIRFDWSTVADEKAPADELAARRKLAIQEAALEEIEQAIARLLELGKSGKAPKSLLAEIAKLDEEKIAAENLVAQLDREVESITEQQGFG